MLLRYSVAAAALCLLTSCDKFEPKDAVTPPAHAQSVTCMGGTEIATRACQRCADGTQITRTCTTPLHPNGSTCGSTTCTPACTCAPRQPSILNNPSPRPPDGTVTQTYPPPANSSRRGVPLNRPPERADPEDAARCIMVADYSVSMSPFGKQMRHEIFSSCKQCAKVSMQFSAKIGQYQYNSYGKYYLYNAPPNWMVYDAPASFTGTNRDWTNNVYATVLEATYVDSSFCEKKWVRP